MHRQDLDGDVAIELYISREVDDSHAAPAELALERVLTGQGGLQVEELGGGIGHDLDTTGAFETCRALGIARATTNNGSRNVLQGRGPDPHRGISGFTEQLRRFAFDRSRV